GLGTPLDHVCRSLDARIARGRRRGIGATPLVDRQVPDHPEEPRTRVGGRAILRGALQQPEVRLLNDVLGCTPSAEDPPRIGDQIVIVSHSPSRARGGARLGGGVRAVVRPSLPCSPTGFPLSPPWLWRWPWSSESSPGTP